MKSLTEILIYGAWLVSLTFTLLLFLQCICLKYIHKSCSLKYFPLSKFVDNDYVLLSAFFFFFFWFSSEDGFHFNTISDYIEAYRLCHLFLQFFSEAIVQNQQ